MTRVVLSKGNVMFFRCFCFLLTRLNGYKNIIILLYGRIIVRKAIWLGWVKLSIPN